jgi:hypothetical protein
MSEPRRADAFWVIGEVLAYVTKSKPLSTAVIANTGMAQGSTGVPWRPNTGLGITSVGNPMARALTVAIAAANHQRALVQRFQRFEFVHDRERTHTPEQVVSRDVDGSVSGACGIGSLEPSSKSVQRVGMSS